MRHFREQAKCVSLVQAKEDFVSTLFERNHRVSTRRQQEISAKQTESGGGGGGGVAPY